MWIVTYQHHCCFKYYEYSHRIADSRISLGLGRWRIRPNTNRTVDGRYWCGGGGVWHQEANDQVSRRWWVDILPCQPAFWAQNFWRSWEWEQFPAMFMYCQRLAHNLQRSRVSQVTNLSNFSYKCQCMHAGAIVMVVKQGWHFLFNKNASRAIQMILTGE